MDTQTAAEAFDAPAGCELPAGSRPARRAEFEAFFARDVTAVERTDPGRARLVLRRTPQVAARAAALAVRETVCCSFFVFALAASAGALVWEVTVPDDSAPILDAFLNLAAAARAGIS